MTKPGGYVAGDILTASNMNLLPGGTVDYAIKTSDQNITGAGPTDITSLTVTFTAVAGRRYKITGHCDVADVDEGDQWVGLVRTSAATIGRFGRIRGGVGSPSEDATTFDGSVVHVPGAGSVTYKLSLERISGSSDVDVIAAATNPAYILVEDIGV